jgi:glutathionyl-hydroquinone reductase
MPSRFLLLCRSLRCAFQDQHTYDSVAATPSILNYCREIYQLPGVAETVNMEHIKTHYFTSHPYLNKFAVITRGNNFESLLKEPHSDTKEQEVVPQMVVG